MIVEAWHALGGDPALLDRLAVNGDPELPSPFAVGTLAVGAVGAQLLAAADLAARSPEADRAAVPRAAQPRAAQPPAFQPWAGADVGPSRNAQRAAAVVVHARHVGVAFRSERYLKIDGLGQGPGFAPLSRFIRTADGWVRLHANYPQHRAAVDRVLGPDPLRTAADLSAQEVEDNVVAAGGVAAKVRTVDEWSMHAQGAAVRSLPLLQLGRVAAASARRRGVGNPRTGVGRSAVDEPLLRGVRVLDLTRVIAGPVGTRTLASYGADVLRVNSPRHPEDPASLLETGPGKRHVELDLGRPLDRRTFEELLAEADVLVQGYRPGALAAFGLHPDELAARRPGLVVVSLSAWGSVGPWSGRRGFDSIVQAATGIADETRTADGTPGVLPAQALDHGAGHLLAAIVLRALARARAEGGTWHGELSLARLAAWLVGAPRATGEVSTAHTAQIDPTPFLMNLPSAFGTLTLVRPPGSPAWERAPERAELAQARWLSAASPRILSSGQASGQASGQSGGDDDARGLAGLVGDGPKVP